MRLLQTYSTASVKTGPASYEIEVLDVGTKRSTVLRQANMSLGKVLENKLLTPTEKYGTKRHLEFLLPEGSSYQTGDYLAM